MMEPKGPLDASVYTNWLRQKANSGMYNNDINRNIPQNERKSIVSKAPAADLPAAGLFAQLVVPAPAPAPAPAPSRIDIDTSSLATPIPSVYITDLIIDNTDTVFLRVIPPGSTPVFGSNLQFMFTTSGGTHMDVSSVATYNGSTPAVISGFRFTVPYTDLVASNKLFDVKFTSTHSATFQIRVDATNFS